MQTVKIIDFVRRRINIAAVLWEDEKDLLVEWENEGEKIRTLVRRCDLPTEEALASAERGQLLAMSQDLIGGASTETLRAIARLLSAEGGAQ